MLNGFVNLLTNINTSSVILRTLTTPFTNILKLGLDGDWNLERVTLNVIQRLTFTAAFNLMKVFDICSG